MILDLQGKLDDVAIEVSETSVLSTQEDLFTVEPTQQLDEAIEALKALGYSEREIKKIKKELESYQDKTTDEYLRIGLKLLMKK